MRFIFSISWLTGVIACTAMPTPDLLRFTNGDQLHGKFQGINGGPLIVWQREDLSANIEFKAGQLRHLVFNGGKSNKSLATFSHLACVNGDRLPGEIVAIDEKWVTLDSPYAGELKLPRSQVAMIAPSPLGGRIFYHGPFVEAEWQMAHASFPDGLPPQLVEPAGEELDEPSPERWIFSGSAWYWPHQSTGTALLNQSRMPDRGILKFDVAWKNRLSLAVAFQVDFAVPGKIENAAEQQPPPNRFVPGDSSALPLMFGNGYVMHFFSSHIMLYRTAVNGEGVAGLERVQVNTNNLRLGDSGKATIEIRSNRLTGQIILFINEEFAAQWSEASLDSTPSSEAVSPRGFGFVVQAPNSKVRLSDIIIAEWNGMPDSARSLQSDEQDIVLLTNGTDRFSGTIQSLQDGKMQLLGRFGDFTFPLEDVAEVRFAKKRLDKASEEASGLATIRFSPIGKISGKLLAADRSAVRLLHPLLGEISCTLEAAVMLEFQSTNNLIDDWDTEF